MYRPKNWEVDSRRMEKQNKKKNWLGPYWKSCIFVPPTPGSELKKRMQKREEELRAEGRLKWPIKIIETAGKTLEQTLVNTDPFNGNVCNDKKCLPTKNPKTKLAVVETAFVTESHACCAFNWEERVKSQQHILASREKICIVG